MLQCFIYICIIFISLFLKKRLKEEEKYKEEYRDDEEYGCFIYDIESFILKKKIYFDDKSLISLNYFTLNRSCI